jgi:CheY-like chemotaxis protein
MSTTLPDENRRVLVIDDNASIHEDFSKILGDPEGDADLDAMFADLFGEIAASQDRPSFELSHAMQGQEGLEKVREALSEGAPYALAFVDVRMPPGWDGVQTVRRLWEVDPDLQVVLCTAFSDYSWRETIEALGHTDRLLILKKPFDTCEVQQMALALTRKWGLGRQARQLLGHIQELIPA